MREAYYEIGVEDMEPGHWVAWVFGLLGCFATAATEEEAAAAAPAAITEHFRWLMRHGHSHDVVPVDAVLVRARVAEVFQSYAVEDDYWINAFFADDRRPLAAEEVEEGIWLLGRQRDELLAALRDVPAEALEQPLAGEKRGSVHGILRHIAGAERWYFSRLGFPADALLGDTTALLRQVREETCARLPQLVGDARVTERAREQWSARKVLRRTLWHERDHTHHIAKILRG